MIHAKATSVQMKTTVSHAATPPARSGSIHALAIARTVKTTHSEATTVLSVLIFRRLNVTK